MGYLWKTAGQRLELVGERAERRRRVAVDGYGHAAALAFSGGRVQLIVTPGTTGAYSADMIMTQDDARRLALALAEHLATGSPRVWTKLEGPADDVKQIECCGKRYVRSLADGYWTDLGSPQERMTFSQLRARGDVREVTE
jgi:hypothetical protein